MAAIPSGSLAFSGFGDAAMKFHSSAGVDLGAPASAPTTNGSCAGIVGLSLAGPVVATLGTGGGDDGLALFDRSTWVKTIVTPTVLTGPHMVPVSTLVPQHIESIARDDAGNVYGLYWGYNPGIAGPPDVIGVYLGRYDSAGAQTGTWLLSANAFTSAPSVVAVNGAGTVAYYATSASATISAWDLVGGGSLGTFTTETGYSLDANALLALSNGDVLTGWHKGGAAGYVKHYNSAGTLLYTYTLPGGGNIRPLVLTPNVTDASIVTSQYSNATTASGVTVSTIELVTGTVLHTFDPDDGLGFEYDGPFCVVNLVVPAGPFLAFITDSQTNAYRDVVVGGGSLPVLGMFNGTDWIVIGQ